MGNDQDHAARPGHRLERWLPRLLLPVAMTLSIAAGGTMAAARSPAGAPREPMRVSMRDVVLYPYDDVAASVAVLEGHVLPDRPPKPIVMDDLASYRIDVDHAEMRLTAEDMTRLMDRHILPSARTPIRQVQIGFGDNQISMSGTMVKLGLPVPFTATAILQPTQAGAMRVHITSMKAAGLITKGMIDALGLPLSELAQPRNQGVFHIEGDDMIVPVLSMFPPPRVDGRLVSVHVAPDGMVAVLGTAKGPTAENGRDRSFIHFRGGMLVFARLTMHDTDMVVLPGDGATSLAFSPAHYYEQMEAGFTKSLPGGGLAAHVRNFPLAASAPARSP